MRVSQIYSDITQIINRSHADLQDLTSADDHTQYLDVAKTRPPKNILSGNTASKPGTCAVGDIYFDNQAIRLYLCQATNTWDQALPELHKATHASGGTDGLTAAQMAGLMLLVATTQGDILIRGASTVERLAPGTSGQVLTSGGAAANPAWGSPSGYSGHLTILPFDYESQPAGTWAVTSDNVEYYLSRAFYNSSNGDGDSINFKIDIPPGTYTLVFMYHSSSARGIADISIGGVEVASFDMYAGAAAYNVRGVQASIVVAVGGIKDLTVTIDGKNGSSSGYGCIFGLIALWRTA